MEQTVEQPKTLPGRTDAEAHHDSAVALDREFMRSVAEKNKQRLNVPGNEESKRYWVRHTDSVKRQIKLLGNPEPGTLEWQYRQELLESLRDAPL